MESNKDPVLAGFNRGLEREFVEKLNEMYERGDWWHKFVDDRDLFLAIRDNYLNVYYRGCSLLKLSYKNRTVVGEINYKYLLRPHIGKSEYVGIVDGRPSLPEGLFLDRVDRVHELKAMARKYAGDEKTGVHNIIRANENVVDVEVAFGGSSNLRIDLAALKPTDRGAVLVFFEAKHFSNQGLRANEDGSPGVLRQIDAYSEILRTNQEQVVSSYRRVLNNMIDLRGVRERHPARHRILERTVDAEIQLDDKVGLVVFGFDADHQRDGARWRHHRTRLENRSDVPSFFRGSTRGFKLNV